MDLLLQQLVNGLSNGALYAIFAVGFGLIFANMGILNVAQGTFATWGVIPAYLLLKYTDTPFWLALLAGVVGGGLVGLASEWLAFRPLRRRNAGMLGSIIVSIGIWIVLLNLAELVLGHDLAAMPSESFPSAPIPIGPILVQPITFLNVGFMLIASIGLSLFLGRTRFGASIRAVGARPTSATIVGVSAPLALSATVFLAGALAGLAGILTSFASHNVSFELGEGLLLKGFAAVVIGGFGSIRGATIAGLSIGVVEALTMQYLSTSLRDAITFGLLLLFLVVRPQGIFGELKVSRA